MSRIITMQPLPQEKIILLKFRTLRWPCSVIEDLGEMLKVKCLKDDKVHIVTKSEVLQFEHNKIEETKKSELRKAYAKAVSILKK